jgi:hypothetical protein
MEFLKVIVPNVEEQDLDVLINRERNGKVGEVLLLSEGYLWVSVDHPCAGDTLLYLSDTTSTHPKILEIQIPQAQTTEDEGEEGVEWRQRT